MTTDPVKISVALAAYNGSEYIAEQVNSLLDQQLPPDEIVISDDSNDDRTRQALPADPRIKYLKNPAPPGVNSNFANALKHCRGEYIFLCDQDDVWLPEKIRLMKEMFDNDPALDGVFCNSLLVDKNLSRTGGTLWELRGVDRQTEKLFAQGRYLEQFLRCVTISSHNIAFRKRVLTQLLPLIDLSPFYIDTFLALLIAACGKWQHLSEALTLYRVHSSNQSDPGSGGLAAARRARKLHSALRNAQIAEVILQRGAGSVSAEKIAMLQNFARFQQRRNDLPANILLRSIRVLFELLRGNYQKYSASLRTAAADILIAPSKD